jgi:hypothetical protein
VTEPRWPDAEDNGQKSELFKAKLQRLNDHAKAVEARSQKEVENELDLQNAFHKALVEGARSAIDRSRAAADTVQKASAALLAVYTGILGLTFSVAEHPLPSRGVIAALFLGLAVVFSSAYLAYLTRPLSVRAPAPQSSLREAAMARTRTFIEWAGGPVRQRAYWLRASVVALGVALMFFPAPFVGALPLVDRLPWNDNSPSDVAASGRPDWPEVPTANNSNELALQKILYTAQVKEAVSDREKFKPPAEPDYANRSWWIAALLGLAAVFLFAIPGGPKQSPRAARRAVKRPWPR